MFFTAYASFYPAPLINSMPKSGTHLLTQVVDLLGYRDFGRPTGLWAKVKDHLGLGAPVMLAYARVRRNLPRRWVVVRADDTEHTIPMDVTRPHPRARDVGARLVKRHPCGLLSLRPCTVDICHCTDGA